jgi:hypothetical protein
MSQTGPQTGKTLKKARTKKATDPGDDPSRPTSSLAPPASEKGVA